MATTILRFEKIKSYTAINLSESHVYRYSKTPNANKELTWLNNVITGTIGLTRHIQGVFSRLGVKPRKNAVLAMDCILSLSNEIFQSEDDIEKFKEASTEFLDKKFKGRCVSAVLHLDESTPHIHAMILPLDKKGEKWKLNARELFSKTNLSRYQKEYFEHMKLTFPKLSPPNFGSKAKHQKVSAYYQRINQFDSKKCSRSSELSNLLKEKSNRHQNSNSEKNEIDETIKVKV
ncbi:MobV family relaxase [Vibrio jasicida]|uniref:MobV family relaxase n=1 Tax=Vibrio jasicida TaxID=766224 RepID=UPI00391FB23C